MTTEQALLKDKFNNPWPLHLLADKNTKLSTNYTFKADQKIIIINNNDFSKLLYVLNTTRNIVIYNPISHKMGGVESGNVISLTFDTTIMDNNDNLLVYYSSNGDVNENFQIIDLLTCILEEEKKQTKLLEKIYR